MVILFLIVVTLASAVNNVVLFRFRRQSYLHSLIFFSAFISCTGHLLLALSTTTEGADIANKMSYAGSLFLLFFLFCVIVDVCNVQLPYFYKRILFILSFVVFGMVCTVGYSDLYYVTFEYVEKYGVGNYVATYGPGHAVFNALVLLYLVADIGIIVYAFLKKKNVSYKSLVALALMQLVSIVMFLVVRQMDNDTIVMPAVYVFDQLILLYICVYVKRYDLAQCVLQSLEDSNVDGYVSISSNMKFLGCNDIAYGYFPDLKLCRVDHSLPLGFSIAQFFKIWAKEIKSGNVIVSKEYESNGKHYKCSVNTTMLSKKDYAMLFKIEEDTEVHRYVQMLGNNNNRLEELAKSNANQIHAIQEQMIVGMANMVESRDSSTGGHIKRTSKVVSILVEELRKDRRFGFSEEFYSALIAAAPMHDLGKIAIDDLILRKPGRFTEEEFEVMKSHAEKGAVIVENLLAQVESPEFVRIAKNVAKYHHERFDGSGYPSHLVGDEIPIEARIMAIADVYDALVSKRCYKDKMSFEKAKDIILESMGTHFDPQLKHSFMNCRERLEAYYMQVEH